MERENLQARSVPKSTNAEAQRLIRVIHDSLRSLTDDYNTICLFTILVELPEKSLTNDNQVPVGTAFASQVDSELIPLFAASLAIQLTQMPPEELGGFELMGRLINSIIENKAQIITEYQQD